MSDVMVQVANLAILTFVSTSMVGLGLSLTVRQIAEPLRDVKLIVPALLANFVIAPAAAWAIAKLFGLSDSLSLGLILLGSAAGAPFLPKLAQLVKGDVAYAVGLMVLLMVVTIGYIPLVLVPLVRGIDVSAWDIARPLVFLMLIPLGIALLVRARYEQAEGLAPQFNRISTVSLGLVVVLALVIGLPNLIGAFGTGAFIAALAFTAACLAGGYLLGGSRRETRLVTALGTGQRNISAALLIATTSFGSEPEVLVMVMVGAVLAMLLLLPIAAELGKRGVARPSDRADAARPAPSRPESGGWPGRDDSRSRRTPRA